MQLIKFDWFKALAFATFASMLAFIVLSFRQYGISNDEEVQHVYGTLLLNFYQSGLQDLAAFQYKNLYLYGGLFDLIAAALAHYLPLWLWDIRHLLSAIFGFLGLVAVYRIAYLVQGARAAWYALLVLALTGAWTGAMFTHTKDISFATCMAWSLYYTLQVVKTLPKIPLSLSVKLGIAVGCALGLRIGGAFAVIYLILMLPLSALLHTSKLQDFAAFLWQSALRLIPAGLTALVLMAIFWPWSVMGPDHIFIAVKSFSHFAFNMNTILDGEVFTIGNVPRSYLFEYLGVRLHALFLVGLAGLLLVGLINIKPQTLDRHVLKASLPRITLLVALFVPVLFVLLDRPALYNGVRHFTFIIPTLAVLSGIGLSALFNVFHQSRNGMIFLTALCVGLGLNTLHTLWQLHPYQYLYYNQLAGKDFKEAVNDWEGDYWSSSLIDASQVLTRYIDREANQPSTNYRVAVCAESFQMQAYLDERFTVTTDWVAADFYVSSNHMHCDGVLQGQVIGTVARLGATLATIKDRRQLSGDARLPKPIKIE